MNSQSVTEPSAIAKKRALPVEVLDMIWKLIVESTPDGQLYNFRFDVDETERGFMACFTPVDVATQTQDLRALLMTCRESREFIIKALGGRLLPIKYIASVPGPYNRRGRVVREGHVPFNFKTGLFCVSGLNQTFEGLFRYLPVSERTHLASTWTRDEVMARLIGFEELAPLLKNIVFSMQGDKWNFKTLYQQDWESLPGPAGGVLPIALARRFPHLEAIGMVNEQKLQSAQGHQTQRLSVMKSVAKTEDQENYISGICFDLWVEWWAWERGFRLGCEPPKTHEDLILQLLKEPS